MGFESKLTCDGCGCSNEVDLQVSHPGDADCAIENNLFPEGKWLAGLDDDHYCPAHASQAAEELDLEYAAN